MLRRRSLGPALLAASLAALPAAASASQPSTVSQPRYEVEAEVDEAGATLVVTRSFHNPGLVAEQVYVDLPLADEGRELVDGLRIQEPDSHGDLHWVEALLLDEDAAQARWNAHLDGARGANAAIDADTLAMLSRPESHDAQLEIFPVPPLRTRTVAYRIFVPSEYVDGEYRVSLPAFDDGPSASPPTLALSLAAGPEFAATVDAKAWTGALETSAVRGHELVLRPQDDGRARARAVDLDLAALTGGDGSRRLLSADLDLPRRLASLPPVRRVVVVVDGSRSTGAQDRRFMLGPAAAYLEAVAAAELERGRELEAEVLIFDRKLRRVYGEFVPARWAAEDLSKIDIDGANGSELGLALDAARELLTERAHEQGEGEDRGVDWLIVLSDLELRHDTPLSDELANAKGSPVRMHVAEYSDIGGFAPAPADAPWTKIARASGGMAWLVDSSSVLDEEVGAEWLAPRRVWSLRFVRELAGGGRALEQLPGVAWAAQTQRWLAVRDDSPTRTRAARFVGEVWGQTRAWSATFDADAERLLAGQLASEDRSGALSEAERAALAHHAGVVSPFTTALAAAAFEGTPAPPEAGFGMLRGYGVGHSFGCGGALGTGHVGQLHAPSLDELVAAAVDECDPSEAGEIQLETTGPELVAVAADDRCVAEAVWALDLRVLHHQPDELVEVRYSPGAGQQGVSVELDRRPRPAMLDEI